MADFSNVSDEELKAELERRQKMNKDDLQVTQDVSTASSTDNPTGISNPADFIGRLSSEWDKRSYTDSGTRFNDNIQIAKEAGLKGNATKDQFGNDLPPTAYEYISQRIEAARAKGDVSEPRLRAIKYEAQARYNLPKNFDISGKGFGNWDWVMSKQLNKMPYNSSQQKQESIKTVETKMAKQQPNNPADSKQTSTAIKQEPKATEPKATEPKATEPKATEQNINLSFDESQDNSSLNTQFQTLLNSSEVKDNLNAAFKRIKNKKASDADLAMFNRWSEEQLRKMGFGPISIQAIQGTKQNTKPKMETEKDDMFSMSYEDAKKKYGKGVGNNIYFMPKDMFENTKAKLGHH